MFSPLTLFKNYYTLYFIIYSIFILLYFRYEVMMLLQPHEAQMLKC